MVEQIWRIVFFEVCSKACLNTVLKYVKHNVSKADNFWHDLKIWHEIRELGFSIFLQTRLTHLTHFFFYFRKKKKVKQSETIWQNKRIEKRNIATFQKKKKK